jgi:hypothetical protein
LDRDDPLLLVYYLSGIENVTLLHFRSTAVSSNANRGVYPSPSFFFLFLVLLLPLCCLELIEIDVFDTNLGFAVCAANAFDRMRMTLNQPFDFGQSQIRDMDAIKHNQCRALKVLRLFPYELFKEMVRSQELYTAKKRIPREFPMLMTISGRLSHPATV